MNRLLSQDNTSGDYTRDRCTASTHDKAYSYLVVCPFITCFGLCYDTTPTIIMLILLSENYCDINDSDIYSLNTTREGQVPVYYNENNTGDVQVPETTSNPSLQDKNTNVKTKMEEYMEPYEAVAKMEYINEKNTQETELYEPVNLPETNVHM